MKKQTSMLHDIIIITIITLVAGTLLGAVYSITKDPIARQEEATRAAMELAVFDDAAEFVSVIGSDLDERISAALEQAGIDQTRVVSIDGAVDENQQILGYVVDVVNSEGYGGDVEIMVGIRTGEQETAINGISFLTLDETAGMGMKAKEEPFIGQFQNLSGSELITYTKSGAASEHEIDAISGATITTTAVVKDVNAALTAVTVLEGE